MSSVTFPIRAAAPPPADPLVAPASGLARTQPGGADFGAIFAVQQPRQPAPSPANADAEGSSDARRGADEGAQQNNPDSGDDCVADAPRTADAAQGNGVPAPVLPHPSADVAPALAAGVVAAATVGQGAADLVLVLAQTAAAPVPPPDAALLPGAGGGPEIPSETGLFILASAPRDQVRQQGLPAGMPAFWAAREAVSADAGAPEPLAHAAVPSDAEARAPEAPVPARPQAADATVIDRAAVQRANAAAMPPAGSTAVFDGELSAATAQTLQAQPASPQTAPMQPMQTQTPQPQTPLHQTPAHHSLTPPALPPRLPAQIAAAIAARPERPLELRLAPAELGGLSLNLRQDGDILRVVLQADRPDTLDLLRRNGDILLEELRLEGFAGASLSFGDDGGARGRSAPDAADAPLAGEGGPQAPPSPPAPAFAAAHPAQGLDLRL